MLESLDGVGSRLTRNQHRVLSTLKDADRPLSAFGNLDRLRGKGLNAPLQVYHALDNLNESGRVHRLESLNAVDMAKVPWMGSEEIRMLVYNGMTVIDLIGPPSVFGALMGVEVHIVVQTLDLVISDAGLDVVPDATFETCPRDLNVLFAPGGTDGTIAAAKDTDTIAFMADRGWSTRCVTRVCWGSLFHGAAGFLKRYKPTSQWSCRDVLAGFGII